ncbi:uncharacterized protein B0I36DRAFT_361828 [Microdochium trichocladiopsis]|uniref:Ubiquitin-like protease family profile domain-containing protein n=1 Tax=Microdochium trichocladiopsis TaxID=1682393 RepID=A0A9P9BPG6_9PEZI|nr:uncharacterized protein B0I36DRAFT_361828 [Microdochium trichocladiopsis]KAH7033114.1 hypothetical protein B0I36DRAFT_361828 [Microdochium trichocladiopsis]
MGNIRDLFSNLGSIRPINLLSRAADTPRRNSSTIKDLSSPQPGAPSQTHTSAYFALPQSQSETSAATPLSRKRSFDTATVVSDGSQSQRTHKSGSRSLNANNVPELRNLPGYGRQSRSKKRPRYGYSSSPQGLEQDPIAIEDGLEDEVQLVPSQDHQGPMDPIALDRIGKRFRERMSPRQNKVDLTRQMSDASPTRERHNRFSPDPLAHTDEDFKMGAKRRAATTQAPMRGDIRPQKFVSHTKGHAGALRSQNPSTATASALEASKRIIGEGLQLRRAVSGDQMYDDATEPDDQHLILSLSSLSSILHPKNEDGGDLDQYGWCTINLGKASRIHRTKDENDSQFVCIARSSDAASSSAGLITLEFASSEHHVAFLKWCEQYRLQHSNQLSNVIVSRQKLEGTFSHNWAEAEKFKLARASTKRGRSPDDLKVIEHNMAKRNAISTRATAAEVEKRPKMRDAMSVDALPAKSSDAYAVLAESPPWTKRVNRTTRSTFVPRDLSPTPPSAPSWTSQNPAWSERWRNSVVYPATGKNRAVVDKADIERLNEGEFLNDNLIIFYLRYLQHNLELQRKDLAERIYFHNTFFFERLKPTKSGAGINYENVKGWTNKVDLFSKDFIVVPINEYAHWYVAIICNAPKLVEPATQELDGAEKVEGDGKELSEVRPEETECSKNDRSSIERVVSDVVDDGEAELAANLSRIQVRSPETTPATTEASMKESSLLKSPARRKKSSKRQSIGRRYDPTMPRIITLDSLASPHSPACGWLKQYLIAELKDKKKIEVADPGSLGMTARDLPTQQNHCDCGLYLLGYIQEFLEDPDKFVRSIMQHEYIDWKLDPSALRHDIRNLLFDLQGEQQKQEDAAAEERKNRKRGALKAKPQHTDEIGKTKKDEEKAVEPVLDSPDPPQRPNSSAEPGPAPAAETVDASLLSRPTGEDFQGPGRADGFLVDERLGTDPQESIEEIPNTPGMNERRLGHELTDKVVDIGQSFVPLLPDSSEEDPSPPSKEQSSARDETDERHAAASAVGEATSQADENEEAILPSVETNSARPSPELHCERGSGEQSRKLSRHFAGKRPGDQRGRAKVRQAQVEEQKSVISLDSD